MLKQLSKDPLILASSSPHRAKILTQYSIPFIIIPPETDEIWNENLLPRENVLLISQQKAKLIAKKYPSRIILSADTVVINHKGQCYFKPKNIEEARENLSKRSNSHEIVNTAFTLSYKEIVTSDVVETKIFYNYIPQDLQEKIIANNEWKGVCGGLRIEGTIQKSIRKIYGEYENIIGLPIQTILPILIQLTQSNHDH